MKFDWLPIYDNTDLPGSLYYETTWRAKVLGGWIVRHEVQSDYQYPGEANSVRKFVDEEGYQETRNTMIFITLDPDHLWEIEWN